MTPTPRERLDAKRAKLPPRKESPLVVTPADRCGAERAAEWRARAEQWAAKDAAVSAWHHSLVPRRHRGSAGWRPSKWPREAQAALQSVSDAVDAGGMVLLVGTRGPGKTQMAVDAIHEWIHRGRGDGLYWRVSDLIADFRTKTYSEGQSEHAELLRLGKVGLLVLDELQDRRETGDEDRILTRLLDHRYGECRPTILIANLTGDAALKSLGSSVIDRIGETGTVVTCDWPSFRKGGPC